jgi:hypothetical protein
VVGESPGYRRQDGWTDAERERAPEASAVELDRVADELADRAVGCFAVIERRVDGRIIAAGIRR